MSIEFACEECGSLLRVPDGTSGKRSRCPTCRHEQEIPWVVAGGQEAVASDKLSIPCPKCEHHLVCSPDLLGTRGQCKKCKHIFTISTEPVSSDSSPPALVFHCPKCQQLFEGREEMRGRKGKCHVCKSVFMIELEEAATKLAIRHGTSGASKPAPTRQPTLAPTMEEDELLIIEDEPAPKPRMTQIPKPATPKPPAPIRFHCQRCRGLMEVPGSTAGLETECPFCQTIQTIPSR